MFDKSTNSKGVLRSETYLNTGYHPDEPVGRDAEVKQIADAVRPLTRRKNPENLLVHGPAGVGKTTCVKHVFDRLESVGKAAPTPFVSASRFAPKWRQSKTCFQVM